MRRDGSIATGDVMATAICKISDVPVNGVRQFETTTGEKLCVMNAGDTFFACQAYCPHEGVALCEGAFDGDTLTCLEHLWQWNVRQGGEPQGLAEEALKTYEVEVIGDEVCLKALTEQARMATPPRP
jgi:toluene monooxygenase system ferredoxin subunit